MSIVSSWQRAASYLRGLAGGAHLRYVAAYAVAKVLPPFTAGPLVAWLYRSAGFEVGRGSTFLGAVRVLGGGRRARANLVIGRDVLISTDVAINVDDVVRDRRSREHRTVRQDLHRNPSHRPQHAADAARSRGSTGHDRGGRVDPHRSHHPAGRHDRPRQHRGGGQRRHVRCATGHLRRRCSRPGHANALVRSTRRPNGCQRAMTLAATR